MSSSLNRSKIKLNSVKTNLYIYISNLELVKLCGVSQDTHLWAEFHQRFNSYIQLYVRKAWKMRISAINVDNPSSKETLRDLTQDVYVKLLDTDRQALRHFQGESENSFLAYLAKIASNIVAEYFRKQLAEKRRGYEMSMETLLDNEVCDQVGSRALTHNYLSVNGEDLYITQVTSQQISELLHRTLLGSNSKRDLLVFKLSVVEGMTSKQVVEAGRLDLKSSSIESIVRRVKGKIRQALKVDQNSSNYLKKAA
ncbi:MAG: hypothetical protein FD167_4501 [bacterium]|nr:MAG: hypothetical protein FD167_4501 [bacterium]